MKITINDKVIDVTKIFLWITVLFAFLQIMNVISWPVWVVFLPVIVILVICIILLLVAMFFLLYARKHLRSYDEIRTYKPLKNTKKHKIPNFKFSEESNGLCIIIVFAVFILAIIGICIFAAMI